jgi:hypothetical protein
MNIVKQLYRGCQRKSVERNCEMFAIDRNQQKAQKRYPRSILSNQLSPLFRGFIFKKALVFKQRLSLKTGRGGGYRAKAPQRWIFIKRRFLLKAGLR